MSTGCVLLMPPGASIFESRADAIVSPVDCTAAQGAGLALEIRRRYLDEACSVRGFCRDHRGEVFPGGVIARRVQDKPSLRAGENAAGWVLFVATKRHYRDPSLLGYIQTGMTNLYHAILGRLQEIGSVAIPALGCGLGGLAWADVLPIIQRASERLAEVGVRVEVYPPHPARTR